MEIHERIQHVRKSLDLSRRAFGEKLGVSGDVINNIENNRLKRPDQKEPIYRLICKKFNVSEEWLRTGTGDMFLKIPEEDETAALVYDLLGPEKDELYDIILSMIKSYKELSPSSQQVIRDYVRKIRTNMKKENED
ncbi:helix-turn-helix domain-containing protein [Enterocloster asparagiformis]|uniref:DNA-binding helix-turn-helix protein n=1 Tax=[Clostridium] asparagiforme DSM 15981 TaxID=518636 RepID=C0D708_9FIRM|nr:helix-turn-helix transcriptional regulator [Enterocloster asparagiformis]EEG52894.1 DNA-binding helix-turn-helix protein [[Clostridium] asparagiforme DSM 15981]UWO77909.1 helix-turn-helix transcriptional regulator [[Clostridium] asparagiforme DSM 15981]